MWQPENYDIRVKNVKNDENDENDENVKTTH